MAWLGLLGMAGTSWPGLDFLAWLVLLDLSGLLGLAGLLDLAGTSWQLMEHT